MADDFADFAPLDLALEELASRIAPGERKQLGRAIATDLRGANAKRIRANVEPEGEPMVPRKAKGRGGVRPKRLRDKVTGLKRSVKMAKMFSRATAPQYLRKESSDGEAQVGFVGAMARIMRVHQYGLRDTVTRDPNSPAVTYPERAVIGLTAEDRLRVLEKVTAQLQP
jgi:phage virion morphogenesis protein